MMFLHAYLHEPVAGLWTGALKNYPQPPSSLMSSTLTPGKVKYSISQLLLQLVMAKWHDSEQYIDETQEQNFPSQIKKKKKKVQPLEEIPLPFILFPHIHSL